MDLLNQLETTLTATGLSTGRLALLILALRALCEGISALRNGTGLIGLWRSILFGQNVPRPIATDYQAELAEQAPSPPPPALSSTHTIKPIPPHQPTDTKP